MNAHEINDLFEQESPVGQLYVKLKELGTAVEREWWIDEEGTAYAVDLALPVEDGWLPVTFGDRPGPTGGLHFTAEAEPDACLREVQAIIAKSHPGGDKSKLRERVVFTFANSQTCISLPVAGLSRAKSQASTRPRRVAGNFEKRRC